MDIFKEIKDIEKVYEDLISSAKDRNLNDIEQFRADQQEDFELYIGKKNDLVNNILGNLAKEVNEKIIIFEEQIGKAIEKIENQFQKSVTNLHKLIIKKVELSFNG
ncbi:MAG: hypothetical protein ACXAEX_10125 [Promethearchaeota archaeon]|jgi:hypothetical protein